MSDSDIKNNNSNSIERTTNLSPKIILGLTSLNTAAILTFGSILYIDKHKALSQMSVESIAQDNTKTQNEEKSFAIPLDYFLVNLAEDNGLRQFKVQMEFDVNNADVLEEINKRMPQIRDTNIILLSSLNYNQISSAQGKTRLKEDIRNTVNSYLTKGKINKVLFTHFIYN